MRFNTVSKKKKKGDSKNEKKNYFFACLLFCLSSCDSSSTDGRWGVSIYNRSPNNVVVCGSYLLPDTHLPINHLPTITVEKNKRNFLEDHMVNDKGMKKFDKQKLTIFVVNDSIYRSEPWDTIRKYDKVLKRYELNYQDYKNIGSEIIYP